MQTRYYKSHFISSASYRPSFGDVFQSSVPALVAKACVQALLLTMRYGIRPFAIVLKHRYARAGGTGNRRSYTVGAGS
ncbi:hypothetical protein IG631_14258 [Alternaria alternata]|nr:hypothetical protein IG631_14258 [Alternaria alternata]